MKYIPLILIFLLLGQEVYTQETSENEEIYEVFLIDSYVTPEIPYTFVLSFFTMDSLKASLVINGELEYKISEEYFEDHKGRIDISGLRFDSLYVPFYLKLKNEKGNNFQSQVFEFALPSTYEIDIEDAPGLFTTCCLGGVIFGLPSPNLIFNGDKNYLSLSKEISLLTYYSGGYNYPSYYLSIEYTYIFDAEDRNIFRPGIKKIFVMPVVEYLSAGLSYFNNFKGTSGISPEITVGWFKISNVFTLYTRYRHNLTLNSSESGFNELSLGLYSSFFSINL